MLSRTALVLVVMLFAQTGCGGGSGASQTSGSSPPSNSAPVYSIGGSLSGLMDGAKIQITNSTGSPLILSANGTFVVESSATANSNYDVSIITQPPAQHCVVANGSGSVSNANIQNISVTCTSANEHLIYSYPFLGSVANVGLNSTPVDGHDGYFYGVTSSSGPNGDPLGANYGSVYRLSPSGNLSTIFNFTASVSQGAGPTALTLGADGNLYGVTSGGGQYIQGTLFKLTKDGTETVLYSFGGYANDGVWPLSLIQGTDGNFYGTTQFGGANGESYCFDSVISSYSNNITHYNCLEYGYGTVFKITPDGHETILHSFGGAPGDASFGGPIIQGDDGNLYGITMQGGANGTTICNQFSQIAVSPECVAINCTGSSASCVMATCTPGGTIYSNNYSAIAYCLTGYGTVYRVTLDGTEAVLYSFGESDTDGMYPTGLIQGDDGNLYGTTLVGGANGGTMCSGMSYPGNFSCVPGAGTFFKITPAGSKSTLYSFGSSLTDGTNPGGSLVKGIDGNIYGVTAYGGLNNSSSLNLIFLSAYGSYKNNLATPNNGTIYRMKMDGSELTLYSFLSSAPDIVYPNIGLFLGSDGTIYGAGALLNQNIGCNQSTGQCAMDTQGGFFSFGN